MAYSAEELVARLSKGSPFKLVFHDVERALKRARLRAEMGF